MSGQIKKQINDPVVQGIIDKILEMISTRHSRQIFYGAAALNVHILRDPEILDLLQEEGVLEEIIRDKYFYEVFGEGRSGESGVTLHGVLKCGLDVHFLFDPANKENMSPEQYSKDKANYEKLSSLIIKILAIPSQDLIPKDFKLLTTIDSSSMIKELKPELKVVIKEIESDSKQAKSWKVPKNTRKSIQIQTIEGFQHVIDIILKEGKGRIYKKDTLDIDNFCDLFLKNEEALLDGFVIHQFYDTAHILGGLTQGKEFVIGKKEYSYSEILTKLLDKLEEDNKQVNKKYSEAAYEQILTRIDKLIKKYKSITSDNDDELKIAPPEEDGENKDRVYGPIGPTKYDYEIVEVYELFFGRKKKKVVYENGTVRSGATKINLPKALMLGNLEMSAAILAQKESETFYNICKFTEMLKIPFYENTYEAKFYRYHEVKCEDLWSANDKLFREQQIAGNDKTSLSYRSHVLVEHMATFLTPEEAELLPIIIQGHLIQLMRQEELKHLHSIEQPSLGGNDETAQEKTVFLEDYIAKFLMPEEAANLRECHASLMRIIHRIDNKRDQAKTEDRAAHVSMIKDVQLIAELVWTAIDVGSPELNYVELSDFGRGVRKRENINTVKKKLAILLLLCSKQGYILSPKLKKVIRYEKEYRESTEYHNIPVFSSTTIGGSFSPEGWKKELLDAFTYEGRFKELLANASNKMIAKEKEALAMGAWSAHKDGRLRQRHDLRPSLAGEFEKEPELLRRLIDDFNKPRFIELMELGFDPICKAYTNDDESLLDLALEEVSFNIIQTILLEVINRREIKDLKLFFSDILKSCSTQLHIKVFDRALEDDIKIYEEAHYQHNVKINDRRLDIVKRKGGGANDYLRWLVTYPPNKELLKVLLTTHLCNVNGRNEDGETAIILATKDGSEDIVKVMLEAGANANVKENRGKTALMLAICYRHKSLVKVLLEARANVHVKDSYGDTALIWAIRKGHHGVAKLLLENGADVTDQDNEGNGLLALTSLLDRQDLDNLYNKNNAKDIMQLLFQYGADVNAQNIHNGEAALMHYVSKNEREEEVQLLLSNDAAVDIEARNQTTALMISVTNGVTSAARQLIDAGAKIDRRDKSGETPLFKACARGYTSVVELLLERRANPSISAMHFQTPLMIAAYHGHQDIVSQLVARGVHVGIRDKHGSTALEYALNGGHILEGL